MGVCHASECYTLHRVTPRYRWKECKRNDCHVPGWAGRGAMQSWVASSQEGRKSRTKEDHWLLMLAGDTRH